MKTLQELIDEFLAEHAETWDTCRKAFLECDYASVTFVAFCRTRGLRIDTYTFEMTDPNNPDPLTYCSGLNAESLPRCSWHVIAATETHFIDWTVRQYVAERPYPYVWTREGALAKAAGGWS